MTGQSERVRGIIIERYLQPALKAGRKRISVRARDVLRDAEATADFPRGRTPMVCNVLLSKKLLEGTGLTIESTEGPHSLQSRTVVVHYTLVEPAMETTAYLTSTERAERFVTRMRDLLKDGVAEHGGAECFVQWLREDEGPER